MNKPLRHSYWGQTTDHRDILKKIKEIGPILEKNAPADEAAGELTKETFEALRQLRMSHSMAPEDLGGAQLPPRQVLELIEAITWYSGSAGWVSMVHTAIGAMSAAFLPDTAVEKLFAPGTEHRFSGQGAPLGMLKEVEGGYKLNGKWSYGSGFSHATYSHSAAFVDDGNGKPKMDEHGNPIIICTHAPIEQHKQLGNWDVLGLKGTGSIDYAAEDLFIPDDMVYPIATAIPQRQKELFSLGVIGLAAPGPAQQWHGDHAVGQAKRQSAPSRNQPSVHRVPPPWFGEKAIALSIGIPTRNVSPANHGWRLLPKPLACSPEPRHEEPVHPRISVSG